MEIPSKQRNPVFVRQGWRFSKMNRKRSEDDRLGKGAACRVGGHRHGEWGTAAMGCPTCGGAAAMEGAACAGGCLPPWRAPRAGGAPHGGWGPAAVGGEPRAGGGALPPWRAPRAGGCTAAMEGTPGTALSRALWAICCTNWMRVLTVLP